MPLLDEPPEQREIITLFPPSGGAFFPLLLVEEYFLLFQGFVHRAEHGGYFGSVEELRPYARSTSAAGACIQSLGEGSTVYEILGMKSSAIKRRLSEAPTNEASV